MKKLHLICNAHIDPIWQWTWDEGISSAIATFKSAADLADEFDYIFCHNEALLYEAVEKNAPELFKRIQDLVKKGKWVIIGGWYLQPDCLMPSGEALVRQITVGKKYFKEKFGAEPTVAANFDSFGHSVGLVQILAKNGYNGYMICRPRKDSQFAYPSHFFNWISPDGSSVIVTQSLSYNSGLGKAAEKIDRYIKGSPIGMLGAEATASDKSGEVEEADYVLWGVGNHGGGPSRKDLNDIAKLQYPGVKIVHSTPEELFKDKIKVGDKPVYSSLVTCMPGCYSSMARVKQAYRKAENLFFATEKMLAAAKLAGVERDISDFEEAQKRLLLAQFHDTLPGTVVEEGEREALSVISACEKTMRDHRTNTFLRMTMDSLQASDGEFPIFVFNYMPNKTHTVVEVEFTLADQNCSEEIQYIPYVYDENGTELPCQQVKEDSTINLDWRKRIVFEAELKPLGITRFAVRVKPTQASAKKSAPVSDIESVISVTPLLSRPLEFELYEDTADPWGMSEAELVALGKNPKSLRLMNSVEAADFCGINGECSPISIVEDGNVLTTLEAMYTGGKTNAVIQYKLYKNMPFVDLKLIVEFADKNKLLRLKLPIPEKMKDACAVGDGPFVWEEKPNSEISFQKWLGAQNEDRKIYAVINDGVYAGKVEGGYLYLTLLRGAGYCFHPIPGRELYPQDRYLSRIDCGRYTYNLRLFFGNIEDVSKEAELFNQLPYAVNVFPTGKQALREPDRINVEGDVITSAIKLREDGGYAMRFYNPSTSKNEFVVNIGADSQIVTASPAEVVSLTYKSGEFTVYHNEMPI